MAYFFPVIFALPLFGGYLAQTLALDFYSKLVIRWTR
jgi:hypothetical protein